MNLYSLVIGWDNEGANYVDNTYMTDIFVAFIDTFYLAAQQAFEMEVADLADTWNATGFQPGYDYLQPERDCADMNQYAYIWYHSPGITEAANSSWFDQMSGINW